MHNPDWRTRREQKARARGESLRAEIKSRLEERDTQNASDLLPQLPEGVSLSEVAFQLKRLAEEGEVVAGEAGGPYSLA